MKKIPHISLTQIPNSMRKIILGLIFSLVIQGLNAQDKKCVCCTESHQEFNFWIGDWTVYDIKGKIVGYNTILKLYDQCVLQEQWKAVGQNRGTSYNYFDLKDKTWNQTWIDNSGYSLALKGGLKDGKMILKSQILNGNQGKFYNQITWTPNKDQSVTQVWEIFTEEGKRLQEAFRGIYKKNVKTEKN